MIGIHPGVFFLGALLILLLPLDWLSAAVTAALVHELMHILALYGLGGRILNITVFPGGCEIKTHVLEGWKQFLCILAGPLGSFSLLCFSRFVPKLAICGLFQGLYNLVPVLPLDGGRLLGLILYRFLPKRAETVMKRVTLWICILVDILALYLTFGCSAGPLPLLFAGIWNIRTLGRKIPCKPLQIGLQ